MVVEDEGIAAMVIRRALVTSGHDVVAMSNSGEDSIGMAREIRPDLILMDIRMPGMDGIEACKRIMQEQLIPIIMVTAYSSPDFLDLASQAGAVAYIIKPISRDSLNIAIKDAMEEFDRRYPHS